MVPQTGGMAHTPVVRSLQTRSGISTRSDTQGSFQVPSRDMTPASRGSGRVRDRKAVGTTTEPGRTRGEPKTAARRTSLPPSLPRPVKLTRDRTPAVPPPAHVRVLGAKIGDRDREAIAGKLGRKLGKFGASIERITVRLTDANGPKGGRDQIAQIKVVLSGLPSVVVEERDSSFQRGVDRAMNSAAVAVRASLQRRRLKPLRDRAQPPAAATF